jgi:hypothetical protein
MPRSTTTGEDGAVAAPRRRSGQHGAKKRGGARGAASGAGASREAKDAIALLEGQHRTTEKLFVELAADPEGRDLRPLLLQLADLLTVHGALEERLFYPLVRDDDTELLLEDAYEDHHDVKELVIELLDTGVEDPSFHAHLAELQGLVEEHVAIEESELFPMAREMLEAEQLDTIAREMAATILELEQEGPPHEQLLAEGSGAEEPDQER